MPLEFMEWESFTKSITRLLSDGEYSNMQAFLNEHPTAGDLIPNGGGLRKLRWRSAGRGKRGGIRVIYYVWSAQRLYFVHAYDKTEQGDLTSEQLKRLRNHIKGEVL